MAIYDYFISYSSKDKDIAFRIVDAIESTGHTCWIAPRNIPYGTPYARAIMEGIDECNSFIVLITDNSIKSEDVLNEVDNAHASNKKIIPVRLTQTQLPRELNYYLSRTQWLFLPSNSPETIVRHLNLDEGSGGANARNIEIPKTKVKHKIKAPLFIISTLAVVLCAGIGLIWRYANGKTVDKKDEMSSIENTNSDIIIAQKDTVYIEKNIVRSPTNKTESTRASEKEKYPTIINEEETSSNALKYKDMISKADTYYRRGFYNDAFPLYVDIAQHYDINYAHKVGHMYENGYGVNKSASEAEKWYKKAAEKGNAGAQTYLAALYMRLGRYEEAAQYYLKADEQGKLNPGSKYWLGYLYFNGKGVKPDSIKARKYWTEAANDGQPNAKASLEKYFSH